MKRFLVVILQVSTMMLALTLVFSCSNQEVSLQTVSTEENNPYKWNESFHVNSSTRAVVGIIQNQFGKHLRKHYHRYRYSAHTALMS